MNPTQRRILLAAGVLGFTGVALGAFGAHGLRGRLDALGTTATWQTAVLYHLLHGVAVLAVAFWRDAADRAGWIAACWTAGVVLFSGSLYWLALGGPRLLGPVTPAGGVCFLVGWYLVFRGAWRQPPA